MRERSAILVILMVTLLLGAALGGAHAQAAVKVATLDMGRVTDEYKALQARQKELGMWLDGKRDYVRSLEDYLFLSGDGFNEVVELLKATTPTNEQKKRLTDLQTLASDKQKQFLDLRAKVQRTPQEEEAYKGLGDLAAANRDRVSALGQQLSAEYNQQIEAARNQFLKNVEEAATALAKQEGYDLVLDASMVLVGGADITDKVLAKLNGGAAPAAGGG